MQRPWHGYQPLGDVDVLERGEAPWRRVGPSAIPALPDWPVPRALEPGDCRRIVDEFAVAARRCRQADFDILNVHGAHGYLIHSFLSPLSNRRDDEYGGDRAGRMRLALEVAGAVRSEWPSERPIFYRLSCIDDLPGGWQLEDTLVLASELGRRGIDVIDCSSQGLTRRGTPVVTPVEPGFQVPYAEAVRRETGIPSCAVGLIMDFEHAERIVDSGQADLVALGREALRNPNWAGPGRGRARGTGGLRALLAAPVGMVARASRHIAGAARRRGLNRSTRKWPFASGGRFYRIRIDDGDLATCVSKCWSIHEPVRGGGHMPVTIASNSGQASG